MTRYTPTSVTSGNRSADDINNNLNDIKTAINDTLSRKGDAPNAMETSLNMNNNRVMNVGTPGSGVDAARFVDLLDSVDITGLAAPSLSGNAGKFLKVNDDETALTYVNATTNIIDVKSFGAIGDGVEDDTAALQAALDYVAANGNMLFLSAGFYRITENLVYPSDYFNPLVMIGEGIGGNYQSTIVAYENVTKILHIDTEPGDAIENVLIRNIFFEGNNIAEHGIYCENFANSVLELVRISGTTIAAVSWMEGWDMTFRSCFIRNNYGDGIVGSSDPHAALIEGCVIVANDGIGIRIAGGLGTRIIANTIETNKQCGIYLNSCACPTIVGNYFESNSQDGYEFTSPTSRTVKSDIILNGTGTDTTMGAATPIKGGMISSNNVSQSRTTQDSFVYLLAASNIEINNNNSHISSAGYDYYPCIAVNTNREYSIVRYIEFSNNNFGKPDQLVGNTNNRPGELSTFFNRNVSQVNYAPQDVFQYGVVTASGGGRVERGDIKYNGYDTIVLTNLAAGSSDLFGFTLNMDNYPELAGQTVYFGAYVKTTTVDFNCNIYIDSLSNNSANSGTTDWRWMEIQETLPDTGTVKFAIRSQSPDSTSDKAYFARPTLAIMGSPRYLHFTSITKPTWSNTAAPTVGTWARSDIVYNSAASASGSIGWVCTTAGTPGTWKTFGTISA